MILQTYPCTRIEASSCAGCGTGIVLGHPLMWHQEHGHHHGHAEPILLEAARQETTAPDLFLCLGIPLKWSAVGPLCLQSDDEHAPSLSVQMHRDSIAHWHGLHVCTTVPAAWTVA